MASASSPASISYTNPSGIITTTSGGFAKKVAIEFHSQTSDGRKIDIYGSNTAYSSPSNLYSSPGTKIGSTTNGGTITFTDDYKYFGLRSNSGAIYVSSITVNFKS